ncbi:MAG TPA: septum site-determining protein Ssd [Streptosporangiaceae bacterium]
MPDHAPAASVHASRPLVLTADDALLDDLNRFAAAADTPLAVTREISEARRSWRTAPLILVGVDRADALASVAPPKRANVVIVVPATGRGERDVYRTAVAIGAADVLELPDAESWLTTWIAEAGAPASKDPLTVCVAGGCGGAGATVTAAGLAVTAAQSGKSVLLVDADPLGGGVDLTLGMEGNEGARWPEFTSRRGRLSAAALRGALPSVNHLAALSCIRGDTTAIPATAMRAVLNAAVRGAELVVVDLPRQATPAAVEALTLADVTLLVVPCEVRGVAAAATTAKILARHTTDLRVVTRPGHGQIVDDTVSGSLGLAFAGRIADEPGLAASLDAGIPPGLAAHGPIARFCREFLADPRTNGAPELEAAS